MLLFIISLIVNVGMWLERFVIVVTSLHRDFLPSSWGRYSPTVWDWGLYVGTIGLFLSLLFLFLRFLPMISIFEMRTLVPDAPDARLKSSPTGNSPGDSGGPGTAHSGGPGRAHGGGPGRARLQSSGEDTR